MRKVAGWLGAHASIVFARDVQQHPHRDAFTTWKVGLQCFCATDAVRSRWQIRK